MDVTGPAGARQMSGELAIEASGLVRSYRDVRVLSRGRPAGPARQRVRAARAERGGQAGHRKLTLRLARPQGRRVLRSQLAPGLKASMLAVRDAARSSVS